MWCVTTLKQGSTTIYIKRVYESHKIDLQKTYGYQYCGNGYYFITRTLFTPLIFTSLVIHNPLHHFVGWYFNCFTVLPIS